MNWDLTKMYNGFEDPAFEADMKALSEQIDAANRMIDAIDDGDFCKNLHALIELICDAQDRAGKLSSMIFFSLSADTNCAPAIAQRTRFLKLNNELELMLSRFTARIAQDDRIEACCDADALLSEHKLFFRNAKEAAAHLIDPALEPVVLKMRLSGGQAWVRLRDELFSGLTMDVCIDGETKRLPLTAVRALAYDARPEVREAGYKAEIAAYPRIETAMAACLNGIKAEANTVAQLKHYDSVLDWSLTESRMDRETLDALMRAMRASMPMFRRYFRLKNRALCNEGGLKFQDLFAPIGNDTKTYTLEEARDLLVRIFSACYPPIANVMARAFDERLIDAYPREGKEGGAFCGGVHAIKRAYVLTNFDGAFGSVSTLAHELGHAYQDSRLAEVSPLLCDLPMPLAETASTFNEYLLAEQILATADASTAIAILDEQIGGAAQVIVDIMSRFLFESEVVDRCQEAALSAEELCDIMRRAQLETYGDGLDENYLHPYMWACKPHYYDTEYHFYNYPYAFGQLFSAGLYALYEKQGEAFWPMYDALLTASGSGTIREVAASAGVDVADTAFWRGALELYAQKIDRMEALIEKL